MAKKQYLPEDCVKIGRFNDSILYLDPEGFFHWDYINTRSNYFSMGIKLEALMQTYPNYPFIPEKWVLK